VTRRSLLSLASAGGLASYWLPGASPYVPRLRPLFGIESRAAEAQGVVLTFDDGPHPQGTPAVLDELARHGARATFFLVGEQVARRPTLAREIVARGHEVAVHCYRHRSPLRLGPRALADDVRRAAATIAEATGQRPDVYRPPYGRFSLAALVLAHRRRWRRLLWTHDAYDWHEDASVASIVGRLTAPRLAPSDVLLLHDADFYTNPGSWRLTVAALPFVCEELARLRLEAVPVPPKGSRSAGEAQRPR
jgi:peptidoglycan-N-acetylglucosamine deacetylase